MPKPAPEPLKVGDRVTVIGYHKSYRPKIVQLEGEAALIASPEFPDPDPKWVNVKKLDKA